MHVSQDWETLAAEIEDEWQDKSDQETPDKTVVNGTRSEHTLGTERTPQDGGSKECIYTWASEPILLMRITDVVDARHLEVETGDSDEGRYERSSDLSHEGCKRRDVGVMCQFEILGEVERVGGRDIAIRLEEVEGVGVAGEPETTKELGQYVQGDLSVGHGRYDTDGYAENDLHIIREQIYCHKGRRTARNTP
jgi:hypothetical protein